MRIRLSFRPFLDELFLYSGQYTFFYIVLAIVSERGQLFLNTGILFLFGSLLLQTLLLERFGNTLIRRLVFSLQCPAVFTILLFLAGGFSFYNMNLIFFWFTQVYFALLIAILQKTRRLVLKKIIEFLISIGTIMVFIFLTFYYDLMLSFGVNSAAGLLSGTQGSNFFSISNFFNSFREFLSGSTHSFVIISCFLIGFILSLCRIRILSLKFRITELFQTNIDTGRNPISSDLVPDNNAHNYEIAVLYADIRNFSDTVEGVVAEKVMECLSLYFSTWETIARNYGGTVDKYMGDAIMIFFRPPFSSDFVNKAIECAVAFLGQMQAIQEEFAIRNLPIIKKVGIGISAGEILQGTIGAEPNTRVSVIGYPISVASRMEALCREFRQDLIVDQNAYRKLSLENQSLFVPLGEILIRGRIAPMPVYGLK